MFFRQNRGLFVSFNSKRGQSLSAPTSVLKMNYLWQLKYNVTPNIFLSIFSAKFSQNCTHSAISLLHTLNGSSKDFTTTPSIVKSPHYIIFCISMENFTAFSFTTQSFMTQHFSASDYFWGLIFRQIFLL